MKEIVALLKETIMKPNCSDEILYDVVHSLVSQGLFLDEALVICELEFGKVAIQNSLRGKALLLCEDLVKHQRGCEIAIAFAERYLGSHQGVYQLFYSLLDAGYGEKEVGSYIQEAREDVESGREMSNVASELITELLKRGKRDQEFLLMMQAWARLPTSAAQRSALTLAEKFLMLGRYTAEATSVFHRCVFGGDEDMREYVYSKMFLMHKGPYRESPGYLVPLGLSFIKEGMKSPVKRPLMCSS